MRTMTRTGKTLVAMATVLIVGSIAVSRLTAGGAAPCSPDDTRANSALTILLTAPYLADTRATASLSQVNPANLQIVTTNQTCNTLKKQFKGDFDVNGSNSTYIPFYYQVDDRFLVYIRRRNLQEGELRKATILVFDDQFNQLQTLYF